MLSVCVTLTGFDTSGKGTGKWASRHHSLGGFSGLLVPSPAQPHLTRRIEPGCPRREEAAASSPSSLPIHKNTNPSEISRVSSKDTQMAPL